MVMDHSRALIYIQSLNNSLFPVYVTGGSKNYNLKPPQIVTSFPSFHLKSFLLRALQRGSYLGTKLNRKNVMSP